MPSPLPASFGPHFISQLDADEMGAVLDPSAPVRPARVAFASRERVRVLGLAGPMAIHPHPEDPVVVGDWVWVDTTRDPPLVTRRLDRANVLRRRKPDGSVQPVAANLDLALVCTAYGRDLNLRRAERWLALCHEAQVEPLVVLTKADPGRDVDAAIRELEALAGAEAIAVSAHHAVGVDALRARIGPGTTATLLGTSGAGKSTLLNALLGDAAQQTQAVRDADAKGRHTTTARSLFALPTGGFIIDNPGVREVGLVDTAGVGAAFPEIDALLGTCRYRGCRHQGEDGCALDAAVADGTLDAARLDAWRKLEAEAGYEARRLDKAAQAAEQKKWKQISQANRARLRAAGWQKGKQR